MTECFWPLGFDGASHPAWEAFHWVERGYGLVALRTSHNRYLTATEDGTILAHHKRLEGSGIFFAVWHSDTAFSLRTVYGSFVRVQADGSLRADSASGPAEQGIFRRVARNDGTYKLLTSLGRPLVAQRQCQPVCTTEQASYHPLDMPGRPASYGGDASTCQARCAASPGCTHFTYVASERSCHLAAPGASLQEGVAGAAAGPARCDAMMVMRRYFEPEAARPFLKQPRSWALIAFLMVASLTALTATGAAARWAAARGPGDNARSISFAELLSPTAGAESEESLE